MFPKYKPAGFSQTYTYSLMSELTVEAGRCSMKKEANIQLAMSSGQLVILFGYLEVPLPEACFIL